MYYGLNFSQRWYINGIASLCQRKGLTIVQNHSNISWLSCVSFATRVHKKDCPVLSATFTILKEIPLFYVMGYIR